MIVAIDQELAVRDVVPLLVAALVGCGIGVAYLFVQNRLSSGTRIANACIVLTIVICLITRVVDDLATAFIVVGALTLVRLRAAIEDTREFGFLLLSVAAGLGVGERRYAIVFVGALLVCATALFLAPPPDTRIAHRLSATLPNASVDDVRAAIASASPGHALRLRDAGEGNTAMRVDFAGEQAIADDLLARLRAHPGVRDLCYEAGPRGEKS